MPSALAADAGGSSSERAQLSLSLVEAAVGVVFVLTVAASFGIALPDPGTTEAQLDAYASDTTTVMANEPPRHGDATRVVEVADAEAFDRERDALDRRVDRILPDNLLYRVTTPGGSVGFDPPRGTTIGRATVVTPAGEVIVEVWYA
ncbi:DUF7262 family protein [Halorubrum sp. DTA98]|uniref:DUF7262 family protein n=1 Tax=Halorubrum sp. DTA98 TaxID=3402163 RepID=UPI003AAC00C1